MCSECILSHLFLHSVCFLLCCCSSHQLASTFAEYIKWIVGRVDVGPPQHASNAEMDPVDYRCLHRVAEDIDDAHHASASQTASAIDFDSNPVLAYDMATVATHLLMPIVCSIRRPR